LIRRWKIFNEKSKHINVHGLKRNSNKLMRMRIIAQFIAVLLILVYVYFRKDAG